MLPTLSMSNMLALHIINTPNATVKIIDVRQIVQLMESSYFNKTPLILTKEEGWVSFNHNRKALNKNKELEDSRGNVISKGGFLNGNKILRISTESMKTIYAVGYPETYYRGNKGLRLSNCTKSRLSFNLFGLDDEKMLVETLTALDVKEVTCINIYGEITDPYDPLYYRVTASVMSVVTGELEEIHYVILPKRKVRPSKYIRCGVYEETVLTF